jgi:hypothetical protein
VATGKGTLLRYCECRKTASDWAEIDIKISRSGDGGATWDTVLMIEGVAKYSWHPFELFLDGFDLSK